MKKIFTSLCLVALCGLGAQAQVDTLMRVSRNDGRIHYIPITKIHNVDFVEKEAWVDPTPNKNTLEDYFDIKVTRCERVSTELIVEFSVTNRAADEYTLTFDTYNITSKDDLSNNYAFSTYCAFGEQGFANSNRSITVDGYSTKYGKLKINEFDTSNKATSVSISPKVGIDGETLDINTVTIKANIDDNRPIKNGVQTCDKNLKFDVTGCERVGNVLILDYTLQNTGTKMIQDFTLGAYNITCTDDLGNSYSFNTQNAFGKQGYSNAKSIMLDAGEKVNGRFRISSFDGTNNAEYIWLYAKCTSSDYVLEAGLARFMKISITDNRVLARGIKSCDRNLDFKFVKFTNNNGTAIIDYTITNTSNVDIQDFAINCYNITCKDDLGNSYSFKTKCTFGDQGYADSKSVEIEAGQTVAGHLKITEFKSGASYVNIYPKVSSSDYILDDPNNVYFLQIPTE